MNHETKKRPTGSYSLIFRAFVFLVLLAGCHGASGPDVLIEHNNQNLRGALQGCTADDCTLDQKPVPRSAIDWIGFRNQPPPPQAESAVADEVHLTDASVHPGKLVSVDAAKVVTESGDYPRDRVAWIHLANPQQGGVAGANEDSHIPPDDTRDGYGGVWRTKGRLSKPDTDMTFAIEAEFRFTLSPSGSVACGTVSQPYCGSARVSFEPPGRVKNHNGDWCTFTHIPSTGVFKIHANGAREGDALTYLTIAPSFHQGETMYTIRFDCPDGRQETANVSMDAPTGSIQEGVTIALPLRGKTTATKHESNGFYEVDHAVELYPPGQKR